MANISQIHSVACPFCHSQPNDRCVLKSGREATSFHNERARAADDMVASSRSAFERGEIGAGELMRRTGLMVQPIQGGGHHYFVGVGP